MGEIERESVFELFFYFIFSFLIKKTIFSFKKNYFLIKEHKNLVFKKRNTKHKDS